MRFNRFATLGKIILFIVILFGAQIKGLAQSNTDLIAHYVEVIPAEDGISYNVNVYLSVMDAAGNLIRDLQQGIFALQEDGQKVEIQNLHVITEEPINIVLVIDASANMSETDMTNAKSAATAFIAGLKPNDQIALVTFDTSARNQVDSLTADHNKISDMISKIAATRETGTCLYDATYSAIKMFSTQPNGNRAVILLTNGKDEKSNGAICSNHTADDVIGSASEGELRTPIYVIGLELDSKSDEGKKNIEVLQNFANMTGGLYQNLSSSSKLANTFQALSDLFHAQYILTYTSISAPGSHSLIVSVNTSSAQPAPLDSNTRKFTLPLLPPHLTFTSPSEGETINDSLKIAVKLITQGEAVVERVAFEVNGTKEGEDDTKPYELELDAKKYPIGLMTVSVTAYGTNNTELARSSVNIVHAEAAEAPVAGAPTEEIAPISDTPVPAAASNNSMVYMAIVLGGLGVIAIGVLIFYLLRQQKQTIIQDAVSDDIDDTMPAMRSIPVYRKVEENRKAIKSEPESDALGALTIEASDDPSLVGHRFEITASLVTLGRSADNDIAFPSDKPVSRHHAEIYQISGKLYLRVVETADASGTAQPPKYGTFLNEMALESDPVLLKTGDKIQLGKRVSLKFESYTRDIDADALTYDDDDLTPANDIDKTATQD